jgi:D-glycero-D-manno-heptose 1,7-bisphosphate phosphatase
VAARAAFIDRDGVLNRDLGHVHRIEDFHWLPGALDGLRRLQGAGWRLVVITNQAGIARGLYSEAQYQQLTAHMLHALRDAGAQLAGVYHCPHHPHIGHTALTRTCVCRKPAPGLLHRAAADLQLDLASSVLIGDKRSDLEAGRAAGLARCILVASGHPTCADDQALADAFCPDLAAAASLLTASAAAQATPRKAVTDEVLHSNG